jgi:hypothetical protein
MRDIPDVPFPGWDPPQYRVDANGKVIGAEPGPHNNWGRFGELDQIGTANHFVAVHDTRDAAGSNDGLAPARRVARAACYARVKKRGSSRWCAVASRSSIPPVCNAGRADRMTGTVAARDHSGMTEANQAEYAQRIAKVLNLGVLQDAVAAGLEDQGAFKVDELDLLDALESAGLKLVPDEDGDVSAANAALVESRRETPS